jgi:hypothetical protein
MAQTYNKSSAKTPIPCLVIMAFNSDLIEPLDLIIAVKIAANDFNNAHKDTDDFKYDNTKEGADDFVK